MRLSTSRAFIRTLRRSSRRGMTLVEIMIVIVIIGILMTTIGIGVSGALQDARIDTTKTQIGQIEQALTIYAAKNKGKYPSTSEGLNSVMKYLKNEDALLDQWGNEFQYFAPASDGKNPYEIVSLGADGQEGGTDANEDIKSTALHGGGGGQGN